MNGTVSHVVVVGANSAGWIAACALRRAFRHRGLEVTVVDTGATSGPRGMLDTALTARHARDAGHQRG